MGHARALMGADTPAQQKALWRRIVSQDLSVRATETLVKKLKAQKKTGAKSRPVSSADVYLQKVAEDLTRHFGTKVRIARRGRRGRVEIEFYGNDDLDRLIARLKASS
jgi:ParB family chromosome partitioning protein